MGGGEGGGDMSFRSNSIMSCPCTISRPLTVALLLAVVWCGNWRLESQEAECRTVYAASTLSFSVSPR